MRRLASEIVLDNVGSFIAQAFDETFYAVSQILDTKTLQFNVYERSETVRETLLSVLLKLLVHIQKTFAASEQLEKAHLRYCDVAVSLLCAQSADRCAECRM